MSTAPIVAALSAGKYVVWDLDNCLVDDSWRLHTIDWDAPVETRWARYHALCGWHSTGVLGSDKPANMDAFRAHVDAGHTPIFLTARPESVRNQTESWLQYHFQIAAGWPLIMRPEHDHRPSAVFKSEALSTLLRISPPNAAIVVAVDDYTPVIDAYRKLGLNAVCLRVHDHDAHRPPSDDVTSLADLRPTHVTAEERQMLMDIAAVHEEAIAPSPSDAAIAPSPSDAAAVLQQMARTFSERNSVYQDNYKVCGRVMHAMYPDGLQVQGATEHELMHLWILLLVKATRFVNSGHAHIDSVHDIAVYAAMIESILTERQS